MLFNKTGSELPMNLTLTIFIILFILTELAFLIVLTSGNSTKLQTEIIKPQIKRLGVDLHQLEIQAIEKSTHSETLRFHSVVKGVNSYNETIFESGKLIKLHVKEGQLINKDDVIADLYSPVLTERLNQARARLKKAEAQLSLDRESFLIAQKLLAKKLIAQHNFDKKKRDFNTSKQVRKEAASGVELAKNQFSDTSIKARGLAIVAKIFKREGDFVRSGEPVLRLELAEKQKVSFALPEKTAVLLKIGDQYKITIPSISETLIGTVSEKSLPTSGGLRLHTITFDVNTINADLIGLHAVLHYVTKAVLAYKVDYRAIHYNAQSKPYIIQRGDSLHYIPVSIVAMKNEQLIVSGLLKDNLPLLIGNELSLPIDLYAFNTEQSDSRGSK